MQEEISPTSLALMSATCAASFATLYWLFVKHIAGRPLLAYQPRKSVPWGAGTAAIALFFTLSAVFATLVSSFAAPPGEPMTPVTQPTEVSEETVAENAEETEEASPVLNGTVTIAFVLGITWLALNWLRLGCQADTTDLGLPPTQDQLLEDIRIGAVACLAAFLPIYIVQIGLTLLLEPGVEHPLIEQLQEIGTPTLFLVSVLLAVVVAPLSEEVFFRLILQGWLEKWEDRIVGFQSADQVIPQLASEPPGEAIDDRLYDEVAAASGYSSSQNSEQVFELPNERPSYGFLGLLPHGWLPILVSGSMFGLAHLGQGVAPVALVLFGIVLGYVYQRTHRIVPTITAHALFNGYSMLMLWLQMA